MSVIVIAFDQTFDFKCLIPIVDSTMSSKETLDDKPPKSDQGLITWQRLQSH